MSEMTYEDLKKSVDLLNVIVENLCKAVVELRENNSRLNARLDKINNLNEEINSLKSQVRIMTNEVHFR